MGRIGAGWLYRVSQGDEVDGASAQFFVNSSLAPVLLVCRWDAPFRYWDAVCRQGPCGPVRSLEPWVHWIPLICMAFTSGCLML